MKRVIIGIAAIAFPVLVVGQMKKFEYAPKVKNRIEIRNLPGEISLKSAGGSTIVIESDFNVEKPERAEGLNLLGAMKDNTGLGVNISEVNGIVSIQGSVSQVRDHQYTISIPSGIALDLDYNSPFTKGDVVINSHTGSVEVKTLNADVKLSNCSGPLTIFSVSGNVEVTFSRINQDEPSSLASVSGLIDISVPASDKVTFEISNMTGNVYNNLDLESVTSDEKDSRVTGMKKVKHSKGNTYTLNGGGQKIYLNAVSGNIYLRKK